MSVGAISAPFIPAILFPRLHSRHIIPTGYTPGEFIYLIYCLAGCCECMTFSFCRLMAIFSFERGSGKGGKHGGG